MKLGESDLAEQVIDFFNKHTTEKIYLLDIQYKN